MLLRPRQKVFVDRSLQSLTYFGNTLGVAPTGAGKTILFSYIVGKLLAEDTVKKVLVIAHRDELTEQNNSKFLRINPEIKTSKFNASIRSWDGAVTFAMVQTLSRAEHIASMPAIDLLVIDEAHHATAPTYQRIIDRALDLNPNCKIIGLTATPNRADGQGLREVFSNVSDQISLGELISTGHLVYPKTYVIDVGVSNDLRKVKKSGADFDMSAVDLIMNQKPVNSAVVEQWKKKAENRQTVIFCSTVEHAKAVAQAFTEQDIKAVLVTGQMTQKERSDALLSYTNYEAKIIVNVQVLTEGWDHPPTSCVVLLRPSSAKSTMIQMVGRGLRTMTPQDYPGVVKNDCIILDFGTSSIIHGSLEQDIDLDGTISSANPLTMSCPSCKARIPLASTECPICGYELGLERTHKTKEAVTTVEMMEINLLDRSSFEWVELFDDYSAFLATGFNAWAGIFTFEGTWYAIGGKKENPARLLMMGERILCLASADDWLNEHETEETAYRSKDWLQQQPTESQIRLLPKALKLDFNLTRYQASAHITFKINKDEIKRLVLDVNLKKRG